MSCAADADIIWVCMAAGLPVKTVVADSVWQAVATGNFDAIDLTFGQKLSDKVDRAFKTCMIVYLLCYTQHSSCGCGSC